MHKPLRRSLRPAILIRSPAGLACGQGEKDTPAVPVNVAAADASEIAPTPGDSAKLPRAPVDAVDHGGEKLVFDGLAACETQKGVGARSGHESRGQHFSLHALVEGSDVDEGVYALPGFGPGFTAGVILVADGQNRRELSLMDGRLQMSARQEMHQGRWLRQLVALRLSEPRASGLLGLPPASDLNHAQAGERPDPARAPPRADRI